MTFNELCEKLKEIEETLLLELLNINSSQIVDRFEDVVEERRDYIEDDLEADNIWEDDEEEEQE